MPPVFVLIIVMECDREIRRDPCPFLSISLWNWRPSQEHALLSSAAQCRNSVLLQQGHSSLVEFKVPWEVVWASPHFLLGLDTCDCLQNVLEQRTHGDDGCLVTAINCCPFGLDSGHWVSVKTGLFFSSSECSGPPNSGLSSLPVASGYMGAFSSC